MVRPKKETQENARIRNKNDRKSTKISGGENRKSTTHLGTSKPQNLTMQSNPSANKDNDMGLFVQKHDNIWPTYKRTAAQPYTKIGNIYVQTDRGDGESRMGRRIMVPGGNCSTRK